MNDFTDGKGGWDGKGTEYTVLSCCFDAMVIDNPRHQLEEGTCMLELYFDEMRRIFASYNQ